MKFALLTEILFKFNSYLFILIVLVVLIVVYFYYKITIPKVKTSVKYFLILLRWLTISLIILLIFEPTIIIKQNKIVRPKALIIIDDSQSMKSYSATVKNVSKKIAAQLKRRGFDLTQIVFGKKLQRLNTVDSTKFNEPSTNFDNLFDTLLTLQNYENAFLISDGNITVGSEPLNKAERLPFPLFTIGVGRKEDIVDVEVKKVLHNSFAFVNKPTTIRAEIISKGIKQRNVFVKLVKKGKVLSSKKIQLSNNGINFLNFNYVPKTKGEKRLTIRTSNVLGDINPTNNSQTFFIKVLSSKIKVLLITSSPNYDFEFIKNSLRKNKDFSVGSIIELTNQRAWRGNSLKNKIDSADVIGLVSFPTNSTSFQLLSIAANAITKKPYFIMLSNNVSFVKLKEFKNNLNFKIITSNSNEIRGNLIVQNMNNSIFGITGLNVKDVFEGLPPAFVYDNIQPLKPTFTLVALKQGQTRTSHPFIIYSSNINSRSLSIFGGDIWRWALSPNISPQYLFDAFWKNVIKWLNAAGVQNRIKISPTKKVFFKNEEVNFSAEALDEKLTPINDANISVIIKGKRGKYSSVLLNKGNGLYEGKFVNLLPGEYRFYSQVKLKGKNIFSTKGKFFIKNINVEKIKKKMNVSLLKLLAKITGGKYYYGANLNEIFNYLQKTKSEKKIIIKQAKEIRLTFNPYYLFIIILFFSLELLIRKRIGLI